jgi:hypothetical protein
MISRNRSVSADLMGGIGNQLFIYFAGRYLAAKCNSNLVLRTDLIAKTNQFHPGLAISALGLQGTFSSEKLILTDTAIRGANFIHRKIKLLSWIHNRNDFYFLSDEVGYDTRFENLRSPRHIHGYFQTWRFAQHFLAEFRRTMDDYVPKSLPGLLLLQESKIKLPVVIHIRLGDYTNEINKNFGVMGNKYYEDAVKFIVNSKHFSNQEFWVYSDDIIEAKRLYSKTLPPIAKWVDETNLISDLDVFAAMRNASSHIIGNSSFSWWAAYSSSDSKLTIAPSKWFMNMQDPIDLLPQDWNKIESDWRITNE